MNNSLHSEEMEKRLAWLLFFYSVPSKPVSNRMKVWRMLAKNGAIQLKGAVYILPDNEEHYELFQWLVATVTAMQGEAAFVRTASIESMADSEIIHCFGQHAEKAYKKIEANLNALSKDISMATSKAASAAYRKLQKEFDTARKTDFFHSDAKKRLNEKFAAIKSRLTSGESEGGTEKMIRQCAIEDYTGRCWVTRKRPFADRMASAWLIRRFIDHDAIFRFIEEHEKPDNHAVTYDIVGGAFTHVGDMTTFEVMLESFSLKSEALDSIAEIVHQLDFNDDKFCNQEVDGLKGILEGIRKSTSEDAEALEKGMNMFEMLYLAKS